MCNNFQIILHSFQESNACITNLIFEAKKINPTFVKENHNLFFQIWNS